MPESRYFFQFPIDPDGHMIFLNHGKEEVEGTSLRNFAYLHELMAIRYWEHDKQRNGQCYAPPQTSNSDKPGW